MTEEMVVSENMINSLNATRPWVKFLAILGFVFTGLIILGGVATMGMFSAIPSNKNLPEFFGPLFGIIYLLMGIFMYLIPCIYLLRYGQAIDRISSSGQVAIESALAQQKSFWKYMGIFAIVMIVLYVLLIVGVLAFAIFGVLHHV